jgi:hypothetical protein
MAEMGQEYYQESGNLLKLAGVLRAADVFWNPDKRQVRTSCVALQGECQEFVPQLFFLNRPKNFNPMNTHIFILIFCYYITENFVFFS